MFNFQPFSIVIGTGKPKIKVFTLAMLLLTPSVMMAQSSSEEKLNTNESVEQETDKLLRLMSLEEAFQRTSRNIKRLQREILRVKRQLQKDPVKDRQKELETREEELRKELIPLVRAMNVVFTVGNRRIYEYNPVNSNVYLKVGSLEQAFARAVKTKEKLIQFIELKKKQRKSEKDLKSKDTIQKELASGIRQLRLVNAALQTVFGIVPSREYTYNPSNATLYLQVSEEEVKQIRRKLAKEQLESKPGKASDKDK